MGGARTSNGERKGRTKKVLKVMLQQFNTKARWKAATVATCVLLSTCVHGTTAAAAASLNPRPNILLLLVEDFGVQVPAYVTTLSRAPPIHFVFC